MSYGYSLTTVQRNREADGDKLGVALGRVCIERCIPVSEVAKRLRVTRPTIYNWFEGTCAPSAGLENEVASYLASLQ